MGSLFPFLLFPQICRDQLQHTSRDAARLIGDEKAVFQFLPAGVHISHLEAGRDGVAIPQQTAQGINLLYFLPSAACALFFHIRNRLIRWDIVLPAALGGCVTAAIAAWIATGLDVSLLRRLFGGFLLLTGLRELFFRQQRDKNAR